MALPVGSSGNVAASSQKPGAACDTLQRLLTELCKRNSTSKEGSLLTFRKHVEEEARDLNGEALTRFLDSLYERISALIDSTELNDNLGALHAINALVDVKLGESAAKTARFSNYIRRVFEEKHEPEVLVAASDVLGRLAESGGPQTADVVETQVKRALEWLQGERIESRRFAAVLILKEMADHAPTVFNMHVPEFIDAVWVALRDQKLAIRERAVEALRSCLKVIVKRETRWRVQWYFRMFEATQGGLAKNASVESIHGSLLAVGELLRNTGEFMMSRYKEVSDIVLKFRDHRDRLVRRSVTALLPRIAHFLRDRFVASYLKMYMQHLLFVMRNPLERAYGFVALGEMAGAVGCELAPFLPEITILLRDAIAPRKGRASMEAIACIGSLTEALGSAMEEHARNMLDAMFASGLSEILVHSLNQIASSLPSLLPMIQERLLDSISLVLCKAPYWTTKKRGPLVRPQPTMPMVPLSDVNKAAVVQLALRTLTTFDLKGHELLEFTREAVVPYLEDDDAVIRRDAARCCCRLVDHSSQVAANFTSSRLAATRGSRNAGFRKHRFIIEEILEKLLVAAVADADSGVRKAVFISLHSNGTFYEFLAQADSLRAIFIALNDEAFEVRELSIRMTGKLSDKNPAYVLPALRRHLQQLLTDLEHSADSKNREESAILLGSLIRACEHLILPYIVPIEEVLVARLREGTGGSGNNAVIAGVLSTVGELARVAGCAIRPYFEVVMPLIVEALLDGAADSKREVAVATIGQLVHSTGYAVTPYIKHPQLLDVLLHLLNGELAWSTKVLKVLGIIGALDPHIHKQNQQSLQAGHADRQSASEGGARAHSVEDFPTEMWPSGGLFATSDDHYSTVAINALMRVLREPSLSSYHLNVVKSLMYICRVMGLGCVPYLPKVMPDLFRTIHSCEEGLREFIFCQLADLVTIVRQHIRKYLPEILLLISEFWSLMIVPASSRPAKHSPILHLVEKLCVALNDEFRSYMPEILPRCIQVLCDAERFGDYSYVPLMLHTLEVFGGTLDEHMHLVLPVLVRLFRPDVSDAPLEIRRSTIKTFARLLPSMQVSAHVSALLHPLTRVLDGTIDELRKDAIDAICALATALGSEFVMFIPSVRKLLQRHHLQSTQFDGIEERLRKREPIPSDLQSNMAIVSSNAAGDIHGLAGSLQHSFELEGEQIDVDGIDPSTQMRNFKVNEGQLRSAWETSQRSTKEDWVEWMRHFSLELLRQSPSPALRTCAYLAQRQPHIAKELFAVAFVSCWSQLSDGYRQQLVRSLNYALTATNIPPEILATLLNLAEFMERDEKPLPVDTRTLGGLAEKCHLFAKALHYKEMEFDMELEKRRKDMESGHMTSDPRLVAAVEALIHVNNQLHQNEAADGILRYARDHLGVELKESWLEKLQRWDDACRAYTTKASQATSHDLLEANLGRMRCLAALARWEELSAICNESWGPADPTARLEMAPMAACAAWNMGEWEDMAVYVSCLDSGDEMSMTMASSDAGSSGVTGSFYRAVLAVRSGKYDVARECVERARKCLATELAALVLESYDRAYGNMVQVQQLAELEEVIDYHMLQQSGNESSAALIRQMWCDRIRGAKRNVEVWQSLLSVRTLVLPPSEDMATWMKFSSLCRKSGREGQARATLVKLLKFDPEKEHPSSGIGYMGAPPVMLAYLKYLWSRGEQLKAFQHLQELASQLVANGSIPCIVGPTNSASCVAPGSLLARVYLKLGDWNWSLHPVLDEESIRDISSAYRGATECARLWVKAWHKFALFNTAVMSHYTYRGNSGSAGKYVVLAVQGFFRSIAHASSKNDASSSKGTPLCKSISSRKGEDDCLQDILRLLTLWFNHGASLDVQNALEEGFKHVNIDTWLVVLPQIIARIHSNTPAVKKLIQSLLVRIGQSHPQALMYPLLVACKSISSLRRAAAQDVVDKVRQHHGLLVEQAQLVSKELIRVAILWHEIWHEALEEASRLYFGEHNVEGMLNVLEPLHSMLENEGAVTVKEIAFEQAYGRELQEAHECCNKYRRTGKEAELTQAWDLYYHVFKRINKQLPSVTTLELEYVSPALLNAKNLELAVPGTYRAGVPVVTIAHFVPQLVVITSKQRPRRCTIHGSDGEDYAFLLKGHEDLRQDERVMQLFGLVNTLLANSRQTAEKDLSIQRYSVIPLAPNSGLIGWVPNHDTLHQLIREYRDARKIPVNVEHRQMLSFAPDYEHLTLIAKVEVFQHALENTAGDDLAKVFWLKSKTSEVWLDRRTNYTRSLAVMSMVGYLLGLGDRHPSNLMLDRHSGKILHIDFGDCFEASMNREKFPEKVPFRLTRMLVKAMEVSGIEGNFRSTCENVMQVLRSNKDSVMAMMEAFVHDPLINWRLFNLNDVPHTAGLVNIRNQPATEGNGSTMLPSPPQRGARERELREAVGQLGDANEVLNERAVAVMARMRNKLTGRDFSTFSQNGVIADRCVIGDAQEVEPGLSVEVQVEKLIAQATSHENLCQSYVGWCPFW